MRISLFSLFTSALAQTYTHCNPLHGACEPNPALGRDLSINFARDGPSNSFTRTGSATIVYDPHEGALFTVAGSGHNPTLQSKFYIMFGKVTVVARAAPGAGVVSSIVLQSDDLDEIDIEFVGNDPNHVQTNYFSKGDTTTYDRGQYHSVPSDVTSGYHTYAIEWNANVIKWSLDGVVLRALYSAERPDIFPQTPMNLRVGSWAAGDSNNLEGTVEWAGGPIDYSEGPFVYGIKSLTIQDYSTGTNYMYTDQSGSWTSITSDSGRIGAQGPVGRDWFQHFVKIAQVL